MLVARIQVDIPQSCGHQLILQITEGKLSAIDFVALKTEIKDLMPVNQVNNADYIASQFEAYFLNPYMQWDIPLLWPQTTAYQKKICEFLPSIKTATTLTYGEVADCIGSGARAVGNACRHNPFPIIIPCHRVVAKSGIGGYSGDSKNKQRGITNKLNIKTFLLQHEQNFNQ